MNTELKGKGMLKVVSILYIVFAAINILPGLLALLNGIRAGAGSDVGLFLIAVGLLAALSGVFGLVLGILGVKWCARPEKAKVLFILGMAFVVLKLIDLVPAMVSGSGVSLGTLAGFTLPVLYVVGAFRNLPNE